MIIRLLILSFMSFWFIDTARAMDNLPAGIPTSYSFTVKDATPALTQALIAAGAGENIKLRVEGMREDDNVAAATDPIVADVSGVDVDKIHNHFEATLLLKAGSKNLAPIKLAGHYDEMTQVPVLKRALQSGEIISEEDIGWAEQPATYLRKTTITDSKQLIGKSPKRMISENRPIRLDEVANPALINKGAHITLLFRSNNLEISTLGEAMDSGAKGDVIRVKNLTSKSIIQGTVETGNIVHISSPESASAEAL